MPTTNPYPVDSAIRTCCGGIGNHTRECQVNPHAELGDLHGRDDQAGGQFAGRPDQDVALPAGAEPDMWIGDVRDVYAHIGHIPVSPDLLRCPTVTLLAEQFRDGSLGCIDIMLDVAMGRSDAGLSTGQARELARLLTAAADLADGWVK